tara:strand:+ start:292 stop:492 length:201 start_codon:yes stop_codon:yes gene_type:complete
MLPKAAKSVEERFIYQTYTREVMSERKKRLQEVNATIGKTVELLLELYQEKAKLEYGESNIPMQKM